MIKILIMLSDNFWLICFITPNCVLFIAFTNKALLTLELIVLHEKWLFSFYAETLISMDVVANVGLAGVLAELEVGQEVVLGS